MAQGTPRKFSEKIAIMERKQNEDQEAFTSVMRDVRAITSNCTAAPPVCSSPQALAPPAHWNRPGGSLPNVHEMVQQQSGMHNWPYWPGPAQMNPPHQARGRSPGAAHYHPYKPSKPQERGSSLLGQFDYHHLHYPPNNHLQPPDTMWPKARSDPTIYMNVYQQQQRLQNFNIQDLTAPPTNQVPPLQTPLPSFNPSTDFFNDMQQRVMREDNGVTVGSLPNIPGPIATIPPCAYHQTITQRHSMSGCPQTLATPPSLSETQSAPTSPAQSVELPAPTSWPQRNYSNSPEPREIPNIVLTGTDGQLDCFQDLQDLRLDANELQQLLNSVTTPIVKGPWRRTVPKEMEMQKSFEDAAFELFKALCPERNFSRDEIPYQTVKEMVERHLNSMSPEKRQHLLARLRGTDQGPSGSDPKIEFAPSSSKPRSMSDARNELLADRHHLLPKLEDFNEAQKIHLKYPKNVRKFVRMRTERRLAAESNDYVNIVCEEDRFPEVFARVYDQILRKRKTSLQCYHTIINTLHHYFMRITWSDLVPDQVDEYIKEHVLRTCNELSIRYDREDRAADIFERLREYELMVLLELHLIKKNPEQIKESEVVLKLGFLVFVADSEQMKKFLDEVVCDQFVHIMPKAIAYVYEELCMRMPIDLENPSSDPGPRLFEAREAERRSSRKSGIGSAALLELERKDLKKDEKERRRVKTRRDDSSPEAETETGKSKTTLRAQVKKAERISKRIAAREKGKAAGARLRH